MTAGRVARRVGSATKTYRILTYRTLWVVTSSALVVGAAVGTALGHQVGWGTGALLLLAVAVSSPYAVRSCGRWLRSVRASSTATLDALARAFAYASPEYLSLQYFSEPGQHLVEPRSLTDRQLCQAWCQSYATLHRSPSAAEMAQTVQRRQAYLDEIERRNAAGLTGWLVSNPSPADDPLPYLMEARDVGATMDWDV
jgi:hypothetical protein